jgi:hypothetical protein
MQEGSSRRARRAGMKVNRLTIGLVSAVIAAMVFGGALGAQQPQQATPPAATLNQIMRGLFFPNSNVVFYTQIHDPAKVEHAEEPSTSTDPLTGVFGGWEAVENSALTLADAADLLMTPGRKCSNGKDAPLGNADWARMVTQVREASMAAYKAALTKDQDNMLKASEVLAASCATCHNRYRPGFAARRCQ